MSWLRDPWLRRLERVVWGLYYVQRLPLQVIFLLSLGLAMVLHRSLGVHSAVIRWQQGWIRFYLLNSGIRLAYDKAALAALKDHVVIVNYSCFLDYMLVFMTLPYHKIYVVDPVIFNQKINQKKICYYAWLSPEYFKSMLNAIGVFPKEPFDTASFSDQSFYVDRYCEAGFTSVEFCRPERIQLKTPYAVMLAQKHGKPVTVVNIENSINARFASVFTPQTVSITVAETIKPVKSLKATTEAVQSVAASVYGETESDPLADALLDGELIPGGTGSD